MEANYNIVMDFAMHQYKLAVSIHVSPLPWTSLPPLFPSSPSRLSQSTSFGCPVSYIKLTVVISFTYVMYMFHCYSLKYSSLSFSHWVQKFVLCVSFAALHIGLLAPSLWIPYICVAAAAAAKLLHSCLTLCDPIDSSPPGSSVPGILQARSGLPLPSPMHACMLSRFSRVWLCVTPFPSLWRQHLFHPRCPQFSFSLPWSSLHVGSVGGEWFAVTRLIPVYFAAQC